MPVNLALYAGVTIKLIICILTFTLFQGCTTSKYREFDGSNAQIHGGEYKVRLVPDWTYSGLFSLTGTYGSPYKIFISFHSENKENLPKIIRNISIKMDDNTIYNNQGGIVGVEWSNYRKYWFAYWEPASSDDKLELEHSKLIVFFELVFENNGTEIIIPIEKILTPIYKEDEKSNLFIDILMSV
ncbi:hypothetical protein TYM08_P3588 [Marinicellulosiphila megalodicopiae]